MRNDNFDNTVVYRPVLADIVFLRRIEIKAAAGNLLIIFFKRGVAVRKEDIRPVFIGRVAPLFAVIRRGFIIEKAFAVALVKIVFAVAVCVKGDFYNKQRYRRKTFGIRSLRCLRRESERHKSKYDCQRQSDQRRTFYSGFFHWVPPVSGIITLYIIFSKINARNIFRRLDNISASFLCIMTTPPLRRGCNDFYSSFFFRPTASAAPIMPITAIDAPAPITDLQPPLPSPFVVTE